MSPELFLAQITKRPPAPIYLFLGQEGYQRRLCKNALLDRFLPGEARNNGFVQTDLENTTLSEVLDDACSLSLFSQDRVIWVCSAELALPRTTQETKCPTETNLKAYLKRPTPNTVIIFECSRFDFTGDDKARLERVQQFYAAIPDVVEFRQFSPESIRFLAQELAKKQGLRLGGAELAALLDAVGGDANRLSAEIDKLALFTGKERPVSMEDLRILVSNAAQSTIFALVNALGKRDRAGALRSLDILMREGEYLPLALTFLSTQFRLALAAKEARLNSAQQAVAFFTKIGVRIWRDRAEQVMQTAGAFTREHLAKAVALIYETDKKFREGYRDDRVVMETLILALTGKT